MTKNEDISNFSDNPTDAHAKIIFGKKTLVEENCLKITKLTRILKTGNKFNLKKKTCSVKGLSDLVNENYTSPKAVFNEGVNIF